MTIALLEIDKSVPVLTGLKRTLGQNAQLGLKNPSYYGNAKDSHKMEFLHGVNMFTRFMTSMVNSTKMSIINVYPYLNRFRRVP